MIEFLIFFVCLAGCSYQAFQGGVREGAERTIDKLHTARIISFDTKGNIIPNKFFKS